MVSHRGPIAPFIYQFVGGIRAGMGYLGADTLAMLRSRARFVRVTHAGVMESHPHDVRVTREAPNYWQGGQS
jgi:IMP dehydrogenase